MDFGGVDLGGIGHHGLFDFGGHHSGIFDGHHSGSDMAWLWGGAVDVGGDVANNYAASRPDKAQRVKPPLLLSAGGGALSGLVTHNQKAALGLSLLSGVAMPYLVLHKPNLTEVAISAGVSAVAGAMTQKAKQNWVEKAEARRAEAPEAAARG